MRLQHREQVDDTIIRFCMVFAVFLIVFDKALMYRTDDCFLCDGGNGTGDQHQHAVSDKSAHFFQGTSGKSGIGKGEVYAGSQVFQCIQKCSV